MAVEVGMSDGSGAAMVSSAGMTFEYEGGASVVEVSPSAGTVTGGSMVSVKTFVQPVDGAARGGAVAWCSFLMDFLKHYITWTY